MSKLTRKQLAKLMAEVQEAQPHEREKVLEMVAAYLIENRRTNEVDLLVKDVALELQQRKKVLNIEVESARPLTNEVKADLEKLFKDETACNVVYIHETVNENVVGGLIATTPELELDASVKAKLSAVNAKA